LPVSTERREGSSVIRLEGEFTVTSVAEVKGSIAAELATGNELRLDLGRVEEIDLSGIQLLWSAGGEAERGEVRIGLRLSQAAAAAAREAGFESFPGLALEAEIWEK
jgi:anti-anti-sigma regulatory factor